MQIGIDKTEPMKLTNATWYITSNKKEDCYKVRNSDIRFNFWLDGQRSSVGAMIRYTCKKPLSMYNLLNLTESVNRKVQSGIIDTCNNLLHLDPGLFQYQKYIDTTVNIHRVIVSREKQT